MTRTDDERQVAALLEDAVADVEPDRGLQAIRARTSARRRPWPVGVLAATAVAAAVAVAVVALDHGPSSPASDPGPAAQRAVAGASGVTVYYVGGTGADARLYPERRSTASAATSLDEAVAAAVDGAARDPDYRSPWPVGTVAERAQLSDGVLSVDLSGPVARRPAGMTEASATLALQQLVRTAQGAAPSRLPVTFLVDGSPAATVLGVSTRQPVSASSDDGTLAAVQVATPVDGETVDRSFTVSGAASAFEGNVQWELRQAGAVVRRGFTTTAACCRLSPYSFRVTAPRGSYTLVVHDEDVGEGPPPTRDTKRVTVQ
jgi:hypothetical protein